MIKELDKIFIAVALLLFYSCDSKQSNISIAKNYDLAIVGARVIDPETNLDSILNIGIAGKKIAIITSKNISATKEIDGEGLCCCARIY